MGFIAEDLRDQVLEDLKISFPIIKGNKIEWGALTIILSEGVGIQSVICNYKINGENRGKIFNG